MFGITLVLSRAIEITERERTHSHFIKNGWEYCPRCGYEVAQRIRKHLMWRTDFLPVEQRYPVMIEFGGLLDFAADHGHKCPEARQHG